MIEIRGDKKVLITPISEEDLADIKIGDIVWLDGELMTCRDVAHRRLVEYGRELPYDIKDKAIFHAGPIVRKIEGTEDDYEMVSVGPTTSMRMEKFEYEFTKLTGVRVIVGKGGMGPNTERACKEFGAIHCVFPAGCAVFFFFVLPFDLVIRQTLVLLCFAPMSAVAPAYTGMCGGDEGMASCANSVTILCSLVVITALLAIMGLH